MNFTVGTHYVYIRYIDNANDKPNLRKPNTRCFKWKTIQLFRVALTSIILCRWCCRSDVENSSGFPIQTILNVRHADCYADFDFVMFFYIFFFSQKKKLLKSFCLKYYYTLFNKRYFYRVNNLKWVFNQMKLFEIAFKTYYLIERDLMDFIYCSRNIFMLFFFLVDENVFLTF